MIDHRLAWTFVILGATVLAPGCGSESGYLDDADSLVAEASPRADSELGDGESAATDSDSDSSSSAPGVSSLACATRITYGDAWMHPANHPAQFDDVAGRVYWDRACANSGTESSRRSRTAGRRISAGRTRARYRSPTRTAAASTRTR